ncbi:MAG TPA: PQQ-binding-like beta-propeller repeat protein [Acidobacteriaceae bacterium]|nr:PQQ-binding-like beta-propeller repeat protein [Acidobacteriaceae bacterium]
MDWPVYGGQLANDHYSALAQINRNNVAEMRRAWVFDTGEKGALQTSPLVVGRVLYAYTSTQKVIALDAASGKLLWKFDSGMIGTGPMRGLAYWASGGKSRLFAGVMNFLYALDPTTGKPITSFGENGRIDLRKGLGRDYRKESLAITTPGVVYKNLIIMGAMEPETHPAPLGDVRAFDVRTGALVWRFHTIPRPGEFGYKTWPTSAWKTAGSANNWAGMTVDTRRGIVFVPTGSAVFDFYGGDRLGNDLFADTLLALDANTGKRIWYFQGVHHDIWDRDFPAAPALVTVEHDGKLVDAVAQTTKQGYVYLFNRATGQSLFPIEEKKYPPSTVPGEVASPTQPLPTQPEPYARQLLTADMLSNRTPAAHAWAEKEFKTFRSEGQFVPLSLDKQTVVFPGFDGGAEWGGPAVDPTTGVIYINSNEMAWTGGLIRSKAGAGPGEKVYQNECGICHGSDRAGSPPTFPSLVDIDQRMTTQQIVDKIHAGGGRMPPFPSVTGSDLTALLEYLKNGSQASSARTAAQAESESTSVPGSDQGGGGYMFTGYRRFLDPDGYPAIKPPWGTLNAIDLNSGKYLWKIPLGDYPALAAKGMANTGTENYGGPVVTAGGLLFIGATAYDKKIRAFNSRTGQLLWNADLPAPGVATAITYMIEGKQYVAIAAAGSKMDKIPYEGFYVAFALP